MTSIGSAGANIPKLNSMTPLTIAMGNVSSSSANSAAQAHKKLADEVLPSPNFHDRPPTKAKPQVSASVQGWVG